MAAGCPIQPLSMLRSVHRREEMRGEDERKREEREKEKETVTREMGKKRRGEERERERRSVAVAAAAVAPSPRRRYIPFLRFDQVCIDRYRGCRRFAYTRYYVPLYEIKKDTAAKELYEIG